MKTAAASFKAVCRLYKSRDNILTGVIKGREGEGIVSQGLEEIRNIAPISKEDLVSS